MFIILLNYKVELNIIDKYLAIHRDWLNDQYQKGLLLCSGPQNPRTGGVIIALLKHRHEVEELITHDPFYLNQLADYTIIEFNPVKCHEQIKNLI